MITEAEIGESNLSENKEISESATELVVESQELEKEERTEATTIKIPSIELASDDRFNTQNLQEALRESMQKFMEAAKLENVVGQVEVEQKMQEDFSGLQPIVEEVSELEIENEEPEQFEILEQEALDLEVSDLEDLEALESEVLDLECLNSEILNSDILDAEETIIEELTILEVPEETGTLIKETVEDFPEFAFSAFLNEEYDGQMKILIPEETIYESQIVGQMTIEDILAEQQKEKEAIEAALREEERKQLELAKVQALQEAEDIMERLADVIPRLDVGFTSRNLIKEKYLSGEKVEENQAVEIVANMNQLLQEEIDRLSTEQAQIEEQLAKEQELIAMQEFEAGIQEIEESTACFEEMPVLAEVEDMKEAVEVEVEQEEPFVDLEDAVLEFTAMVEEVVESVESEDSLELEELPAVGWPAGLDFGAEILELTKEQKELFSYITPIKGMEEQICAALNGIIARMKMNTGPQSGNLIVEGGSGSGKTVFATNFIKVLQQITGKTNGKVGKVEANVLNNKDIRSLYGKITGGCLIIESAGALSEDSAENLALLMEQDTNETLVILEDSKQGIEKLFVQNKDLAFKFSERIRIPIFTNDELVVFAKAYAAENGYVIDEMGVLALYNCISNIQKLDRETTIAEVKEIVDNAIEDVESGTFRKAISIFTSTRFDANDYVILHEKNFNN